jgi:hypothetical protein
VLPDTRLIFIVLANCAVSLAVHRPHLNSQALSTI